MTQVTSDEHKKIQEKLGSESFQKKMKENHHLVVPDSQANGVGKPYEKRVLDDE